MRLGDSNDVRGVAKSARRRPPFPLEPLEARRLLSAEMALDLNVTPGSGNPTSALSNGGITYFAADDGLHGAELWRTDGTPEGTTLVRDVNPGSGGSFPVPLAVVGNRLYFKANLSELWFTDGTAQNTRELLGDTDRFSLAKPELSAAVNGELLLMADSRLYRSRPTTGIVSVLRDSIGQLRPQGVEMVGTGSRAYILTDDNELWVSDGTSAGTVLLKSLADRNVFLPPVSMLEVIGDTVFFPVRQPGTTGDYDLWKTQGTAATTALVKDLPAGVFPTQLTAVGSTLFFASSFPSTSSIGSLWKSDGTADGTVVVKSPPPLPARFSPLYLTASGGRLFFLQHPSDNRLWVSDGTADGTRVVRDDVRPSVSSIFPNPTPLFDFNGTLVFPMTDAAAGSELWRSDGTAEGTGRLADVVPGPGGSTPTVLSARGGALGDRLLFSAQVPERGRELWVSDGSAAGTELLRDLHPGTASSNPSNGWAVNGRLIFAAVQSGAASVWTIDESSDVPQALTMGEGGPALRSPENFTAVGNRLFFTANVGTPSQRGLVVTDGTPQGTAEVMDVANFNYLANFTAVGDRLFFTGGPAGDQTLYVTDGTAAGTAAVAKVPAEHHTSAAREFIGFKGTLFFKAGDDTNGTELWRSDGTPAGTFAVTDITSGWDTYGPSYLTVVGERLYFVARSTTGSSKIYVTDGTAQGTQVVSDMGVLDLAEVDGTLIFNHPEGFDYRLYGQATADGVPVGAPQAIADIRVVSPFVRMGRWLFFAGSKPSSPVSHIWRTDGTAQGTMQVSDPAVQYTDVRNLTAVGHLLYFTATYWETGNELWATDGTPRGTYVVRDIYPGRESSNPTSLAALGNTLYFSANNGLPGRELWRAVYDATPGDVNRDGSVDFDDLAVLAQNYNASGKVWSEGDFTGDGVVDFNDLAIMAQRYNTTGLPGVPAAAVVSVPAAPAVNASRRPAGSKDLFSSSPPIERRRPARARLRGQT